MCLFGDSEWIGEPSIDEERAIQEQSRQAAFREQAKAARADRFGRVRFQINSYTALMPDTGPGGELGATETTPLPTASSSNVDEGRFLPGTILAQRYRILSLLGRGGMGEVYRATDLLLGQTVALKFLPAAAARDEGALERFRNEVRVARQVSHPNVCRVYDLGEAEGLLFLSMEYVDGEDLASLLRRIGHLPQDKALEA